MAYKLGDFSFIKDKLTRETLEYDFNIVNNIPGAWNEFYVSNMWSNSC
jgi:hypothetical protein